MQRAYAYARSLWRNRQQSGDVPRLLTYIVTFTCNARCIMCDSWRKESDDDLSLDEIAGIFAQLPRLDAVRLTGGEPFVRTDFGEIAALVREHLDPLVLHVTTNGFLTDRIVRFCETRDRRLPLQLLVSVDGEGDKHNEVRGTKHAWRKVMATLEALAPRQRELGLRLSVNQTIVDAEGVAHYRKLSELLRPMGVRHQMVMAYDVSATYSVKREIDAAPRELGDFTTFGEFTRADLQELLDAVEADIEKLPLPERLAKRYYIDGIRSRLLRASEEHLSPRCVAVGSHMRLLPNGDVPTCQFNTKTIGNLRHMPFRAVWDGAEAETQRTWVRECAGCWAECEVLPSALYTGDLIRHALGLGERRVTAHPTRRVRLPVLS